MIRPDDIRELLKKTPFQTFRIHLSNGLSYVVGHPELAYVMRASMIVAKPATDVPEPIGDGFHIVSILHINNLEVLSQPVGKGANNGATNDNGSH